jgi:hypothetical protein
VLLSNLTLTLWEIQEMRTYKTYDYHS